MGSKRCALRALLAAPALIAFGIAAWTPSRARGQLPLAPQRPSGLGVSPVYEGWYRNADGTISLSFGYINRNTEEVLSIPLGARNSIEGGAAGPGPPTRFLPRRHYGVLAVTVPADFGEEESEVVWRLEVRGRAFAIPGRLNPLYQIDALGAPATGDVPPSLKLSPSGPLARGPRGVVGGPLKARVGEPLGLSVWVGDVHATAVEAEHETEEDEEPGAVWWYTWSGPGAVMFGDASAPIDESSGEAATSVTFGAPGDYVLYVRTNESDAAGAGHEQCCWTNGWVRVTVTP